MGVHQGAVAWIVGICTIAASAVCLAADSDVRAFGAIGDGIADDTEAFQSAIKEAAAESGRVVVPDGSYLLTGSLELGSVSLTGPPGLAWPADIDILPALIIKHYEKPALILGAGASLSGIDINYAWPEEPTAGPAAVLVTGIGCYISNCRLRYPWDGIMTDGRSNVGRLNIENVFIVAPRNVGVRVTGTWDVPALRNIEVWNAGPVPRGLEQGVGFLLGKNDLIRVTDCFAFAMQTGFLFEDEIEGCEIEGGTWGVLTGCSTDYCGRSIVVRGDHTLSISGGTFWTHAESVIVEEGDSRVRLTGAELKSNGAPTVIIRGGDHCTITGCTILRAMEGYEAPAVQLTAGRTVLTGNVVQSVAAGIEIGPGIDAAVVESNLVEAAEGRQITVAPDVDADRVSASSNLLSIFVPPTEGEPE